MSDSEIEKKLRAKTPKRPAKAKSTTKQAASKSSGKRGAKRKEPTAPPKTDESARPRSPILGWIPLLSNRPKVEVKYGQAAQEAKREHATRPLTFVGLMIRLLPIWTLIIMILILEPTLPFKAAAAAINWMKQQAPQRPTYEAVEPVYIVQNPGPTTPQGELAPPNWPLTISPIFTREVQFWQGKIAAWSTSYRIKPNMIATIMQIESCGNPQVASPSGKVGLFQVPPDQFRGGENSADPDLNAERGLSYLGELLATANGDPGRAFAAYHGGASMLLTSPADWPQETQNYQYYASGIYEDAELGIDQSPALEDWLDAGGRSLCAQSSSVLGLP